MKLSHMWILSALAVTGVGAWSFYSSKPDLPGREVRIKGGRTAINFLPNTLADSRLSVHFSKPVEGDDCDSCSLPGFQIKDSNLNFRLVDGKLADFDGGEMSHNGAFTLTSGKKAISGDRLKITSKPGSDAGLNLTLDSKDKSLVAFELSKPRRLHKSSEDQLILQDMEVLISKDLAEEMGSPELAGSSVGSVTLFAQTEAADGEGRYEVAEEAPSAGLDVALSAMSSLAVASNPTAKVGTYPNGRTGLTMSTTSCNVGTVNIPWNAPMQTTHPVIALNLYRVRDGKFEHVGWSWLKHGFLSTNSNGCGTCQNPGTGSLLGLNCSDTYGTGNNSDRTYLGGRDEVNPFTGAWTCQGSWFSNYVNDCVRRNPGSVTLDAVDHRIDCLDSDLGNANSEYIYEAYYITGGNDINTYNNLGSRKATMSWTGTAWSIATTAEAMVVGPAINRWGELRSTATPRTEGDVIVAVQTSNLGGGMYRYEYAVYNHNLDRQVRQFSVPLPVGASLQNIGFRDIDRDAANGWTAVQQPNAIVWSTPAFGQAGANPLKYSSVFNFRFDANVQPATTNTALTLHKPGTGTTLNAATKGPLTLDPPTSYTVYNGIGRGGNLASLAASDENRLVVGPTVTVPRQTTGIIASVTAPAGAISMITLGVESRTSIGTPNGAIQSIEMWNWTNSSYEAIASGVVPSTDQKIIIAIATNASRFVNSSTRQVLVRAAHRPALASIGSRWTASFDQVGIHFN